MYFRCQLWAVLKYVRKNFSILVYWTCHAYCYVSDASVNPSLVFQALPSQGPPLASGEDPSFAKVIKGQLCQFSTLSLSFWIRDIMWNPTLYIFSMFSVSLGRSFKICCSCWKQWCHCFQEELQTVYPSPFPSHSRRASAMFVLKGFSGFSRPKNPRYWKLPNI